jgi:hypothetical protein
VCSHRLVTVNDDWLMCCHGSWVLNKAIGRLVLTGINVSNGIVAFEVDPFIAALPGDVVNETF